MLQGITGANEKFLANLASIKAQVAHTQEQISSGSKLNQLSDDPSSVADVVELHTSSSRIDSFQNSLNLVKSQVDGAESGVRSVLTMLDQAISWATEGSNQSETTAQRKVLADQVQALQAELVSVTATQVEGRYVFGGDDSQSAPYKLDSSSPTGVTSLTNMSATRQINPPFELPYSVDKTAQELFDARNSDGTPAPGNVFAALNTLQKALAADNSAALPNIVDQLKTASSYLNQQLGFYGSVQNRLTATGNALSQDQVQIKTRLSDLTDADLPKAITTLGQAQLVQSAALQAQAQISTKSLFDYMG